MRVILIARIWTPDMLIICNVTFRHFRVSEWHSPEREMDYYCKTVTVMYLLYTSYPFTINIRYHSSKMSSDGSECRARRDYKGVEDVCSNDRLTVCRAPHGPDAA